MKKSIVLSGIFSILGVSGVICLGALALKNFNGKTVGVNSQADNSNDAYRHYSLDNYFKNSKIGEDLIVDVYKNEMIETQLNYYWFEKNIHAIITNCLRGNEYFSNKDIDLIYKYNINDLRTRIELAIKWKYNEAFWYYDHIILRLVK